MISYMTSRRGPDMLFFRRKKPQDIRLPLEDEVQAARQDTFDKIEQSRQANERLKKLLESDSISLAIYVMRGGGRHG